MPQAPSHHAVIDTMSGRYLLLKLSSGGYSKYTTFRLHRIFNTTISESYRTVTVAQSKLKRYAPYLFSNMMLVSFGISSGLISPFQDTHLSIEDLDDLFRQYKKQYDQGVYDTNLAIAP